MICKSDLNGMYFNYKFIEEGVVELTNNILKQPLLIKYEDWVNDYYIIDKLNWKDLEHSPYKY